MVLNSCQPLGKQPTMISSKFCKAQTLTKCYLVVLLRQNEQSLELVWPGGCMWVRFLHTQRSSKLVGDRKRAAGARRSLTLPCCALFQRRWNSLKTISLEKGTLRLTPEDVCWVRSIQKPSGLFTLTTPHLTALSI